MKTLAPFLLALAALLGSGACAVAGPPVDAVAFGVEESEKAHALTGEASEVIAGALEQPARRRLPRVPADWQGGRVTFTMKVDPALPNYFTVRRGLDGEAESEPRFPPHPPPPVHEPDDDRGSELYGSNRALAALTPAAALPEADDYWQLTAKGLTKELGFVGYYGEPKN